MIRILLDRAFDNEHHYIHAVGLSTDTKPTTGIITGSKFIAVDTGAGYLFDETAGEWNENPQFSEAVAAYLDEHPEALDQAAIEALFADQLDGIEEDVGVLKSALNDVEQAVFDITSGTVHQASGDYAYSNGLNTGYVWVYTSAYIPKGANASITIYGRNASRVGECTIYFFAKNVNNTYSIIDTVTLTTVVGENLVTLPSGVTDNNNVYIGFYSTDSGVAYNSKGERAQECQRFTYSATLPDQITLSGSFNMDFNAKIVYALKESHIEDIQTQIEALNKKIIVVDAAGNGDYTNIIDAITTEAENTVILVKPGVYAQDMTSCLRKRIILIGTDRNTCIIRDTDGRYGHHPLYISCGYFENLTIESPYVSGESQEIGASDMGSYAVHIDTDEDYAIGKRCEFYHCNISSDFFPAVGLGMRKNATYIFDDCIMTNGQVANRGDYSDSGTLGALYFHDSNGEQGDQYITVKDCVLNSKLQYAMCVYEVNRTTQNNRVYCNFINNILYSETGHYADTVWFRRNPFSGIFSIVIGYGNSIASLNNNT